MSKNNIFLSIHKKNDNIEKLLDQSIETRGNTENATTHEQKLEVNLIETDREFIVEAPLPGIPYGNIQISLSEDTLTIEADYPEKAKSGKTIYQEFAKEHVSRSIVLPKTFESGSEHAELMNGLLTIFIKKRRKENPHTITITERDE